MPPDSAFGVASAGDVGDAAHGAGQPPVVEFQCPVQAGPVAAVGAVPFGGQGGQFPDGVRVVGPAGGELVAAVFAAQDRVGPLPEFGELCGVFGGVAADPVGGGGAVLTVAVAGFGRGVGEFCHLGAETLDFGKCDQLLADDVVVEPGLECCDLAAHGCDLRSQGGGVPSRRGFRRTRHGPPRRM